MHISLNTNKKLRLFLKFSLCILCFSFFWPKTELKAQKKRKVLKSTGAVSDVTFAEAEPEDINNENFPDIIDSFDYPNANIQDVLKAISELTGKNFIIDPKLSGKISIIAPTPITVAEAYRAFLTALSQSGYTIVPSGKFLKVVRSKDAVKDNIETYSGAYFPDSDQMITRIFKLKHIKAKNIQASLKNLVGSSQGLIVYEPANSLIVSDFGSRIERLAKIIRELDVPGFKEKMAVIPIQYAKASKMAELIQKIIDGGQSQSSRFSRFSSRFRNRNSRTTVKSSANFSLVTPDERTNSLIVVGNKDGIQQIRQLVKQLDFELEGAAGGIYVYYMKYGDATSVANVLNGVLKSNTKTPSRRRSRLTSPNANRNLKGATIFGENIQILAEKDTNSLIITASHQDYKIISGILDKIDRPRDQVSVKMIIMEMSADSSFQWGIDVYKFSEGTQGLGRIGIRTSDFQDLVSHNNDAGAILGFGSGDPVSITVGNITQTVTSVLGLVKLLQTSGAGNVLSQPTITALDNKQAIIEVGENVPAGTSTTSTTSGTSENIIFKDATLKLKIKPFITPNHDKVKLDIEQDLKQLSSREVSASELANRAVPLTTRFLKTTIVVKNKDTAVLGGMMQDRDVENVVKVPLLGDMPLLGWLFKSKSIQKEKTNLLLFITPTILRNAYDSEKVLTQQINDRIDFIKNYMKGEDPYGDYFTQLTKKALKNSKKEDLKLDSLDDILAPDDSFEEQTEPSDLESDTFDLETDDSEEPLTSPDVFSQPETEEEDDDSIELEDEDLIEFDEDDEDDENQLEAF